MRKIMPITLSLFFLAITIGNAINMARAQSASEIVDLNKNTKTVTVAGVSITTDNEIICKWNDANSLWKSCETVLKIENTQGNINLASPSPVQNFNISAILNLRNIQILQS